MSERVQAIAKIFNSGNFGAVASQHIMQDMWEKWVIPGFARQPPPA